ncbi:DUF488 domain-containing protein [Bradyrhizobium sp.]|uniref:DUF488 domain-containing protein n=1 Tax=Bradyrhizobium sp. TaxID=376 RepID=UPI002D388FF9|nr:DUF488 family protein [Bradyrhizobium sp.]HZR72137.1 DUF488 family protein [Bradyrhizobium sp.]
MKKPAPAKRLRLKRVYEPAAADDGVRVLVDRLWPRGLTKKKAAVDHWIKDVAPSPELRKWFGHDPDRWVEFKRRYKDELRQHKDLLADMRKLNKERTVTLLFGARDDEHNDAVVLREVLARGARAID